MTEINVVALPVASNCNEIFAVISSLIEGSTMFLKDSNYFFLFLIILFAPVIYANEGVLYVDLNTKFDDIGRSGHELISNNVKRMDHSRVVELENDYIYFTYDKNNEYRPFLLDKQTGNVSPLNDSSGNIDKPNLQGNSKVFQANAKQAVFNGPRDARGKSNWYITDGSASGTRKWNFPFVFDPQDIRPLGLSDVLFHDGFKLYRYNESSQERIELTSTRPSQFLQSLGKFLIVRSNVLGEYILTDGTIEGTKDYIFRDILIQSDDTHFLSDESKNSAWVIAEIESELILSKIDGDVGIVPMLNLADIPKCFSVDFDLELDDGVAESEKYIYFRSSNGQCFYQYNKSTKELKDVGVSELITSSNTIIGANDDYVLIKKSTSGLPIENIAKFSFEQNELEFLLPILAPEPDLYRYVEVIAEDEIYIYFYSYSFSYKLARKDNALIRLEKNTFTSRKLSSRIGHISADRTNTELFYLKYNTGDNRNNHLDYLNLFADDGRLYFLANNPLPGVYRTDENFTKLEGLSFSAVSNDTQPSEVSNFFKIATGWLAWSANLNTLYKITPNGQKESVVIPELRKGSSLNIFEDGSNVYLQNSNRAIIELNIETVQIRVIHSDEQSLLQDIDNPNLLFAKNGELYIESGEDQGLARFNLASSSTTYLNQEYKGMHLFSCSDKIFGFSGLQSNLYNSYSVSGSLFYELTPEINELPLLGDDVDIRFIDLDASKDGFIVLSSFTDAYLVNCNTLDKNLLVSKEARGPDLPEFSYSSFEQQYYFVDDFILKTVSVGTGSIASLFEVRDFRIASSLAFTANGTYFPLNSNSLEYNTVFKISGNSLLKVADLNSPTVDTDFTYRTVSASGRYIYGYYSDSKFDSEFEYSEVDTGTELLVLDTLFDQLHFVNLYSGPKSGVNRNFNGSLNMYENEGIIAFLGNSRSYEGELILLETDCIVESLCAGQFVEREPSVSDGTSLYYEIGQNVWLPYRAADQDLDELSYQLVGHPNWLSIDENTGLVTGNVPTNALKQYDGITVRVSDGQHTVDSTPFTFIIDDVDQLSTGGGSDNNSGGTGASGTPPPSVPSSSNDSGGGSIGILMIILAGHIYIRRYNKERRKYV